jgi:DNA-binding Lrp family transcriptional regulator
VDDIQRQLIDELQRNARSTNRRLADAVGLAPSSTLQRIRDLEQRGVITGYHAEVDLAALGRSVQAMVFVRLSPADGPTVQRFFDTVSAMPETIAVSLISGAEDAVVHVAVPDVARLRATVLEKISTLDCVADERTSLVFEHQRATVIDPLD